MSHNENTSSIIEPDGLVAVHTVTYKTSDGREFTDEKSARDHQNYLNLPPKVRRIREWLKYASVYGDIKVGGKFGVEGDILPLDTYGIWRVEGEDPNCDMGGPHHNPFLGYYRGTLEQVLNVAVDLKDFYTWGAGGKIIPVTVIDLDMEKSK